MQLSDFGENLVAGRPTPTREQYAAEVELARAYLTSHGATDLLDMVLGGDR